MPWACGKAPKFWPRSCPIWLLASDHVFFSWGAWPRALKSLVYGPRPHGRMFGWKGCRMSKFSMGLIVLAGMAIGAGFLFLQTWEVPPPTEKVERTFDDERFPR